MPRPSWRSSSIRRRMVRTETVSCSRPWAASMRAWSPGLTQERLRTAIARACKASGTPTWSPHDLRHRRISLWHRQGETWALIGARVGQRSLSVTADTYTHVLFDDRELDHGDLVGQPAGSA